LEAAARALEGEDKWDVDVDTMKVHALLPSVPEAARRTRQLQPQPAATCGPPCSVEDFIRGAVGEASRVTVISVKKCLYQAPNQGLAAEPFSGFLNTVTRGSLQKVQSHGKQTVGEPVRMNALICWNNTWMNANTRMLKSYWDVQMTLNDVECMQTVDH